MPFDPTAARAGAVFSTNPNYMGAWVCYINGLEVPILGYQTICGANMFPEATIHVFPEKCMERLGHEDRVQVALFYLDYWVNPGRPEFRLLFDGEIVGWNYANAGSSRSIAFSCVGHIHIFQQLYFFFMNTLDNLVEQGNPEIAGSAITTAGFSYPYQLFHQGLIGAPTSVIDEQGNATNGQPNPAVVSAQPQGPAVQTPPAAPAPAPPPAGPNPPPVIVPPAAQAAVAAAITANITATAQAAAAAAAVAAANARAAAEAQDAQTMITRPFDLVYNVIAGLISKTVPPEP